MLNEQNISLISEIGNHMPGGFFLYQAEEPGKLLYANKKVMEIYGCGDRQEFEDLTGYTFRGMVHPEDYLAVVESIEKQIRSTHDHTDYMEYRIIRTDGAVRWVADYGHFVETDTYGGIYYVFISDITQKREQMETDIAVRQAVIEALIESYHTVWLINDVETESFSLYRGDTLGETIHGLPIRDALQRMKDSQAKEYYIKTTVAPSDQARLQEELTMENIVSTLRERAQFDVTYLRKMKNGEDCYFRIDFAKVDMPGGKLGVVCGFKNVDAETRKSLEQGKALRDALASAREANKAKTTFLSNMSHEIRTPMNAIIGLNNIAMNDPVTSPKTKEYLEKIDASAHHLLNIINDILDMSRIESGRMVIRNEEFSFSKALEQVNTIISGQCREKRLHYECRVNGKVDDYYIGDDMKLRQVMINILGNAVKFTPEGGRISFIIEETARFDRKCTLRFIIRDNGIGMSKSFLPHLFDAFTQEEGSGSNRYGSTGLGMPITKSIVELMNGHIEVESEKGVGTTFYVTITLGEVDRESLIDEEDHILQPQDMRVLVIDDDPVACEHAKIILRQVGVNCDIAESGLKGLEMVTMHHARRNPYHLILVYWKMPEIDGLETTRRIRSVIGHESGIIILTSYNWDEIADEAKNAGVDSFAPKPLFVGTVMDEFRKAFRKKNEILMASKADLKGCRILLAEDMDVNAEIMMMILSMREIEVDHAKNGKEAVEMFASHEDRYYDAILMDMRMPEMNGLEASKVIRAMDRSDAAALPIIALTANAFDEDVQRSMQAGLNAHLSKPVEPEALFDTLESLIR